MQKAKKFILEYYKNQDDLTPYIDNAFWNDNARRMEEYKDQELSLLTEKYEKLANEFLALDADFHSMRIKATDANQKYIKLKEAFEKLNSTHANLRWASIREREMTKNDWNSVAGLK